MTLELTNQCPCESGELYSNCCEPLIEGRTQALTPEQLMRSRYVAFTLEQEEYILSTWHPRTRPKSLNFEDNPVVWLGLEVEEAPQPEDQATEGTVTFTASYLENGHVCRLKETSEFQLETGLWLYLRGTCDVKKEKVSRNDACPCRSGKKFKKCCLRNQG